MAGWRATWEDTGVCTVQGDVVTQLLLPDQPLICLAVAPLARVRGGARETVGPRPLLCHATWCSCLLHPVRIVTPLAPLSFRVATRTLMLPPLLAAPCKTYRAAARAFVAR